MSVSHIVTLSWSVSLGMIFFTMKEWQMRRVREREAVLCDFFDTFKPGNTALKAS